MAYMFENQDGVKTEFWLSSILNAQPKQMSKIEKVNSIVIHSYDEENKVGQVNDYITTLDNCNCADFSITGLPCKHMYKLASFLGLFSAPVDLNKLIKGKPIDILLSYLTKDEFEVLFVIANSFKSHTPGKPLLYNSNDLIICKLILCKCLISIKCNNPVMDNWFLVIPNEYILKSIK